MTGGAFALAPTTRADEPAAPELQTNALHFKWRCAGSAPPRSRIIVLSRVSFSISPRLCCATNTIASSANNALTCAPCEMCAEAVAPEYTQEPGLIISRDSRVCNARASLRCAVMVCGCCAARAEKSRRTKGEKILLSSASFCRDNKAESRAIANRKESGSFSVITAGNVARVHVAASLSHGSSSRGARPLAQACNKLHSRWRHLDSR